MSHNVLKTLKNTNSAFYQHLITISTKDTEDLQPKASVFQYPRIEISVTFTLILEFEFLKMLFHNEYMSSFSQQLISSGRKDQQLRAGRNSETVGK